MTLTSISALHVHMHVIVTDVRVNDVILKWLRVSFIMKSFVILEENCVDNNGRSTICGYNCAS